MRNIIKESGRSILEMLAVLAIIALLTLGGLAGYSYLVQKQRQQESVKEVAQLVMGIRTAGLPRQYDVGETIPAGQVLKGPKMVDGNQVIQLPDDEESYAVVTNLSNGAFALNLQVKPGTCAEILKAFENEDFVMFDAMDDVNASQAANAAKNWVQGRRDGIRSKGAEYTVNNALVQACKTGSGNGVHLTGRASIVFDCAQGSATYGYLYDVLCSGCPAGEIHGLNGGCCDPNGEDTCGLYCGCGNAMCNKEKGQCVECSIQPKGELEADTHCWTLYNNAFNRHKCDETKNKCVECLKDLDCHSGIGPQNPKEATHRFCVDQRCVECDTNFGETGKACPQAKPMCDNGTCQECPDPDEQEWDPAQKKCVCKRGEDGRERTMTSAGTCVLCLDNAEKHGKDTGCPFEKPVCSDEEGSAIFGPGKTGQEGTVCYECVTSENCEHNTTKKFCNTNTHSCVACDGAWDPATNTCRHCQDNLKDDGFDKGCAQSGDLGKSERLCKPDSGEGNGTQAFGDQCYVCRNNHYSDTDKGERDDGCSTESPLCQADREKYGTACAHCINDKGGNEVDTGCSSESPMCNAGDQQYGNECSNCPAGQIWSDKDETCVTCYDSASGGKTDAGCGSGDWKNKPICVVSTATNAKAAGNNMKTNDSGAACALCVDDNDKGNQDSGCGVGAQAGKPICMAGANNKSLNSGNSCVECLENKDCPSSKPGCYGHECKTCEEISRLKGQNPLRTHYVNTQGQDGCYVCIDDKTGDNKDTGCSENEPVCMSGTNDGKGKGGNTCEKPCSGNDKCIDAVGVAGTVGACIPVNKYDDIQRGRDGKCECFGAVKTQNVSDAGHTYTPSDGWDKTCERRTSSRQRLYTIPVNFYCARYMHVSDNAQADDFVAASAPAGIGITSPAFQSASWQYAHDNSITPKVSHDTITSGVAGLVVQDRWLGELGLNGYFYFTTTKGAGASGAVQKLTAHAGWNPGSSQSGPIGGWARKDGQSGCSSSGGSSGGSKRCKKGSHISHDWIKARYKNCNNCGKNTHEKADSDNPKTPHTHWYCYCDC